MQYDEFGHLDTQPMQVIEPLTPKPEAAYSRPAGRMATAASRARHSVDRARQKGGKYWHLTMQGIGAAMLLLAAWGLKSLHLPLTEPVINTLRDTITYDLDMDTVLGKLYFVGNFFPDWGDALGAGDTAALKTLEVAAPALGRVSGKFISDSHEVLDIVCMEDPYAMAAVSGVVESVEQGTDGWKVVIRHVGGIKTIYQPLEASLVRQGQDIQLGAPLGVVAKRAEVRTLSFGMEVAGKAIDPLQVLMPAAQGA
nr:M23 family metallopeptidase [bacterium]